MENVSFKHWIVAGALSGVVIGILLPFLLLFLSLFIYTHIPLLKDIYPFLGKSFLSNIFLGVIIGIILSFMYRSPIKERLHKCLIVSIVIVVLMAFLSLFYWVSWQKEFLLIPFTFIAEVYVSIWMFVGYSFGGGLFGMASIFAFLFIIGASFGFLINYFINRMERKASK